MFGISLAELFIVFIIAILALKPKDIPIIIKNIRSMFDYIAKIKTDITSNLYNSSNIMDNQEINNLNKYIVKIVEKEGKFEGEYNVTDLENPKK